MSHLDPQKEDNKDVLAAKAFIQGKAQAAPQEIVRLLEKVLDDRSNWIAKAAEATDCITDLTCTFQARNEDEQSIISTAIGVSKEIYTMLEPDDSAPQEFKDYVVTPIINLMEGGK